MLWVLRSSLRRLVSFKGIRCLQTLQVNNPEDENFDMVVVGGGIVGMASAREISIKNPGLRIAVVEKESKLAVHQSGHNSGVIHAGIYYKPGSLKAKLCVEGLRLSYKYLDEKQIPYKKVGKLIVATNKVEVERLNDLHERGLQNDVPDLQMIDEKQIKDIEPQCKGLKALWSPQTGIVDWALVTNYYGQDFLDNGGHIYFNFQVDKFVENSDPLYPVRIISSGGNTICSKYVLTCGGLYSDKLAQLSGGAQSPSIVPFRGEYLLLKPEKCGMISTNIYPVPDPRFPFLGVHFTPRMDGSVWLGPNAVLAFKKEGYSWFDINASEFSSTMLDPGFRKLAMKYLAFGIQEISRSIFMALQVRELQKFVPNISTSDVTRGPSGVRAQALDDGGNLVDDFCFDSGKGRLAERILHCRNAPSPGATSSLSIARMMSEKVRTHFLKGR